MQIDIVDPFYLVGGTALALLYGHRDSVDIDLFTHHDFSVERIEQVLLSEFDNVQINGTNKIMLFCMINDVKVDFVNHGVKPRFAIQTIDGIRLLNAKDIAAFKLKAIFQRGSKKDFCDLYTLLHHFSLQELIDYCLTTFPQINIGQLLLSLQYFTDAEETQLPKLYINATWPQIKTFIQQQVTAYILP
jgi:predicted nucleotidyltransferase component of viral defense system